MTKPSKGVKNDGYDNEDSDYILYVNDILGSEEAGHKYDCLVSSCKAMLCVDDANRFTGTVISFSMSSARVLLDKS